MSNALLGSQFHGAVVSLQVIWSMNSGVLNGGDYLCSSLDKTAKQRRLSVLCFMPDEGA